MYKSYKDIKEAIAAGTFSAVDTVQHYLNNIKSSEHLNAFLEVYGEEALEEARKVDEKIKAGTAGKLAGMVVGLKDVICYKDHGLQSSSKILDGFKSQFNATAVERLLEEDAIIIGRQNCDEFAMGSSNENSAFGNVLNAANENKVPGGSSGGSAVAVQADLCMVSLGSDTGGSVRQPAAFCGVLGLKPTYSRISRYGLVAYASSFDTIGIFSSNVYDNALVLEVIAGEDEYDATVSRQDVDQYSELEKIDKPLKIAYMGEGLHHDGVQEDIKQNYKETLDKLKAAGHEVEEIKVDYLDKLLPIYYILTTAEASTNLSRFDGVRFGHRAEEAKNLEEMYKLSRTQGFGEEVKRRIMLGTFVLSASYYDAYFTKAQKVRRIVREATKDLFKKYDYILIPTTPTTAFDIATDKDEKDFMEMYLADIFTVQASVAGIPAISIPTGEDKEGMPIGLQVMADSFQEKELFNFSEYLLNL